MSLVDRGLRSIANAEQPVSLVPRVRAQIAQVPAGPAWRLWALGFAAAALAVAGVAGWFLRPPQNSLERQKTNLGSDAFSSAATVAPSKSVVRSMPRNERTANTDRNVGRRILPAHQEPAVLVSPEERQGLQWYLASLSTKRQKGRSQAVSNDVNGIEPLEITVLDLKELTTEPLTSGGSK
jgi:hypothetical protein